MSMSISGSSSLASLFQTSSITSSQQVKEQDGQRPPPPPKDDEGGMMSSLSDALSKMGISAVIAVYGNNYFNQQHIHLQYH